GGEDTDHPQRHRVAEDSRPAGSRTAQTAVPPHARGSAEKSGATAERIRKWQDRLRIWVRLKNLSRTNKGENHNELFFYSDCNRRGVGRDAFAARRSGNHNMADRSCAYGSTVCREASNDFDGTRRVQGCNGNR